MDRSVLSLQESVRSVVPVDSLIFVMGAYLSNGGKSFVCLSSTFTNKKGETFSRILPTLHNGSVVTDTRSNAHYIVTEYGMANLKVSLHGNVQKH